MPRQFFPGGFFAEIKPRRGQDSRRAVSVDLAISNAHGGFDAGLPMLSMICFVFSMCNLSHEIKTRASLFGACVARF